RGQAFLYAQRRRYRGDDLPAATADATDEDRPKIYKDKYCTDDGLIKTLKASLTDKTSLYSAPYYEEWISYIWSTGANWSGPIGKFHLTIDKGDSKDLISFCW